MKVTLEKRKEAEYPPRIKSGPIGWDPKGTSKFQNLKTKFPVN